jgi:hypothetical protein
MLDSLCIFSYIFIESKEKQETLHQEDLPSQLMDRCIWAQRDIEFCVNPNEGRMIQWE